MEDRNKPIKEWVLAIAMIASLTVAGFWFMKDGDVVLQGTGRGVLPYPLPKEDQRVIEGSIQDFIDKNIFDILWEDFYIYRTQFEGTDGFTILNNVAISGGGADVRSPASGSGQSTIEVSGTTVPVSFNAESRVRTELTFSTTTEQNIIFMVGYPTGTNDGYGVIATGTSLVGFAQTGVTTQTTLTLLTLTASTTYLIDIRYIPGDKVEFKINDQTANFGDKPTTRGVIRSNLPRENDFGRLFFIQSREHEALEKSVFVGFVEYMQRRILK